MKKIAVAVRGTSLTKKIISPEDSEDCFLACSETTVSLTRPF